MRFLGSFFMFLIVFSCKQRKELLLSQSGPKISYNRDELFDKVLGNLVGSAIGDAMGAPTEMWSRDAIKLEYGHIIDVDSMVRETSPEGTWITNLPAGGTTDDTRWKKLTYEFLIKSSSKNLKASAFAKHILSNYKEAIDGYKKIESFDPKPFEQNTLKVAWLQEWAKVAKPYAENNFGAYHDALNKFYGGEMVCAGLLYAPAIGAFYPNKPNDAYKNMYSLGVFDIGYARDISALAAAMTAASMQQNATMSSVLATLRIDPNGYFESRLVGRSSYKLYRQALWIVSKSKKDKINLEQTFALLDAYNQDMPFHAGEIFLQVLTAMLYSDFDFQKTMEFLVNFGRDNDTTAAIAGGILGSYHGYNKLPADKLRVIKTCKETLNIDLIDLANKLTDRIIALD